MKFILLLSLAVFSFVFTTLTMPRIIGVVTFKRLMDDPNERSSHKNKTPSLGGIAFFLVISLCLLVLKYFDKDDVGLIILISVIILFIIGLKDDLVILSPLTKLFAQILSVSIILSNPNFNFTELHGFLSIESLPLWVSIPLSGFIMIATINSYNLIDGIDGLAAIIGIVSFSIFGVLFYMLGLDFYLGLTLTIIGSLLGFLRFNLSSQNKIFMGDTGSLVIGFLLSVMVIRVFSVEPLLLKKLPFQLENLPILVLAVLIVPAFDTARVFTIRILKRKTPFSPDRNHIHHILIDYIKLTHKQASIALGVFNIFFVVIFVFLCANFDNIITLTALLVLISGLVYFFFRINFSYRNLRRRLKWRNKMKNNKILF